MGRTLSDAGRCDACQEGRNKRLGKSLSDAGRSDACNEGQLMGRTLCAHVICVRRAGRSKVPRVGQVYLRRGMAGNTRQQEEPTMMYWGLR